MNLNLFTAFDVREMHNIYVVFNFFGAFKNLFFEQLKKYALKNLVIALSSAALKSCLETFKII